MFLLIDFILFLVVSIIGGIIFVKFFYVKKSKDIELVSKFNKEKNFEKIEKMIEENGEYIDKNFYNNGISSKFLLDILKNFKYGRKKTTDNEKSINISENCDFVTENGKNVTAYYSANCINLTPEQFSDRFNELVASYTNDFKEMPYYFSEIVKNEMIKLVNPLYLTPLLTFQIFKLVTEELSKNYNKIVDAENCNDEIVSNILTRFISYLIEQYKNNINFNPSEAFSKSISNLIAMA